MVDKWSGEWEQIWDTKRQKQIVKFRVPVLKKVPGCQIRGNKLRNSWHLIFHDDSSDIHEMYAAKSLPTAGLHNAFSFSKKRAAHQNMV